jgi:ABC-type glycerol-3-phosphate transport system permease component
MSTTRKYARSRAGRFVNFTLLLMLALFMFFPMLLTINNAFKPLNELFLFPPRLFVMNPTLENFRSFGVLMRESVVPISRYLFNSVFITVTGVAGQIVFASLAGYMISKHDFFGRRVLMEMVILSLMFTGTVMGIPSYIIQTKMGLIDSQLSVILPAFSSSMGLFLMKQFIDQMVPNTILAAARIDGAGELRIFSSIVMPICKPAWMTLIIFAFQSLWGNTGGNTIFNESLKTLPYAFSTLNAGGIVSRAGISAAMALIMVVPPLINFIFAQSRVMETMSTSGIKE